MGESKRKTERMTPHERAMQALTRQLTDEGRLIEAGWIGLRLMWLHPDTPDDQVAEFRKAFMAGAQHLFGSIMSLLESGQEPTPADMARMNKINAELDAFGKELARDHFPTKGSA